jgi:hypothetical protein
MKRILNEQLIYGILSVADEIPEGKAAADGLLQN